MSGNGFERVLMSSVPSQEERFANEHLPDAIKTSDPLSVKLVEKHPQARILSLMIHDPIKQDAFEAFEHLEAVITRSDGFDHLPAQWLQDHGVPGYHLGGYATQSVAHHTLGLMLALLRRFPEADAMTRGNPPGWDRSQLMGRDFSDVTVGVLGVGKIGSAVSRLLVDLGATVRGYDIERDLAMEDVLSFAYTDSLEALLRKSDVLTIHVPLDASTRGMIGPGELALLPEDACVVNTARGGVVDQAAVEDALEAGALGGYAADVLPGEPDPPDLERFARFENVVLTPHLAAYDARTTNARYRQTARIADALLRGEPGEVASLRVV